jgi:hypothetical protein
MDGRGSWASNVFMLYAVVAGILVGLALHGRIDGIGDVRVRWFGLALVGLLVQAVLFSGPVADAIGDLGAPIYVASSAAVLVVVLRNLGVPGLPIVALGAASNLAAIVANGGWMPAGPSALAALGITLGNGYTNSRVVAAPALAPLTDVLALPTWLPFANVFSVGDVLIGVGIFVTIVAGMRHAPSPTPVVAPSPTPASAPNTATTAAVPH